MPPTAWGLGWPGEKIAEIKEFLNLAQMRAETGPGLMVLCCIGGPLPLLWPLVSMSAWDCGQWLCRDCLMATLFPHPTPLSACQPDTDGEIFFVSLSSANNQLTIIRSQLMTDWHSGPAAWMTSVFASPISPEVCQHRAERGIWDKKIPGIVICFVEKRSKDEYVTTPVRRGWAHQSAQM